MEIHQNTRQTYLRIHQIGRQTSGNTRDKLWKYINKQRTNPEIHRMIQKGIEPHGKKF